MFRRACDTPKEVAATDHESYLNSGAGNGCDVGGKSRYPIGIDAETDRPGHDLAAQLQQNPFIAHHGGVPGHYCAEASSGCSSVVEAVVSPTFIRTNRAIEMFSPSLPILVAINCATVIALFLMNGCSSRQTSSWNLAIRPSMILSRSFSGLPSARARSRAISRSFSSTSG